MASLQPPLTIISDSGANSQNFQPPAATWFDEDPLHFVALEARPLRNNNSNSGQSLRSGRGSFRSSIVSGVGSIDSALLAAASNSSRTLGEGGDDGGDDEDDDDLPSEIVQYQAFGLPKHHHHINSQHQRSQKNTDAENNQGDNDKDGSGSVASIYRQPISAFDAAKKAAQGNLKTLTTEISVAFPLPFLLATMDISDPTVMGDDDTLLTDDPTVMAVRRIPILAKFSPKMGGTMRFLACQYTPTMVRIATVEGQNTPVVERRLSGGKSFNRRLSHGSEGGRKSDHKTNNLHWTIDLSYHADPIASTPEKMPDFHGGSNRSMFGKLIEEEGVDPGTTTIIGGGVLWSAREDTGGDITSLDLIVVATTAVIVYNVNIAKGHVSLVKTQVLPHALAASFWYESVTRTLVIGSYKANPLQDSGASKKRHSLTLDDLDSSNRGTTFPSAVMSMKTLFFPSENSTTSTVETLPSFCVGTLREVESKGGLDKRHALMLSMESFDSTKTEHLLKKSGADKAVVLPTQIFLVNLYGSVYCVELGSLGSGQGIGLTKLDREGGCIHVKHHNFDALKGDDLIDVESTISVGVIDNLLCIFSKKAETTYFLDVAEIFSDDHRLYRECIKRIEPEIHDENLAFLAPQYFLDTSGQGLLYRVVLSLPLILECVSPTACLIPFLLRRDGPRDTIRKHIMGRFSTLVEKRDMKSLRTWLGVVIDQYSKSEVALKSDYESTVKLLSKCSLVSFSDIEDADESKVVGHIMVPKSCGQILTQTEILQMILLPHALSAINHGNLRNLRFISSLAIHYFVELERRRIAPSVALQCLVIALLRRTGENAELSSFLSARQSQWTVTRRRRLMSLPTATKMYFENPGAIPYAETLFLIATEEVDDKASVPSTPSTTRQLISYATTILLGCGATFLAVRCLLSAGLLNDAINVCTKKIKPNNKPDTEGTTFSEGTKAKDFFRAAVLNANNQSSVAERCKSFYHLHCFLKQWDPSTFTLESRKIKVSPRGGSTERIRKTSFRVAEDFDSVIVEQSAFAHECPRFPDELFGGKESICCKKLRAMFGYAQSISTAGNQLDKKLARAGKPRTGGGRGGASFAKSMPNINADPDSDDYMG
mmetsp:Transcript_4116/g.9069  ORF Transcript_4116/g.9069 Transcript_4116/m.9069 type:complete len:1111 (+) Transcript_4116:67-3399(+)